MKKIGRIEEEGEGSEGLRIGGFNMVRHGGRERKLERKRIGLRREDDGGMWEEELGNSELGSEEGRGRGLGYL